MNRRRFFKFLGGFAIAATGLFAANSVFARNRYYQGPLSDHFDGEVFFNPGGTPPGSFRDLLKWQFGGGRAEWPKMRISPFADYQPVARIDGMRVTMVGHATLFYQVDGINIITDPVFSDRASPVSFAGPKRVTKPGVSLDDLPTIDLILITHNHYDHMDMESLEALVQRDNPLVLAPLGNDVILQKSIPDMHVEVGDWGDRRDLTIQGREITIHYEPCHHWSARGTRDRRMALWSAFVMETRQGRIYHIGDTGFHSGLNYAAAQAKYGGFRLAGIPVGAYEPRWFMKGQHQNPEEAVKGFKLANCASAVGHHWGTFQLTNEALEAPREALLEALSEAGIDPALFPALEAGQHFDPPEIPA